jgi:hypothetical protein
VIFDLPHCGVPFHAPADSLRNRDAAPSLPNRLLLLLNSRYARFSACFFAFYL